ncbi:alpha/beta fold hydrolase [Kineosporiaceae bacterium SCSIO 59966]|nr:alpha/beta fold hydrolase [Kineosporiaceae bacterium SCSIO 59966]
MTTPSAPGPDLRHHAPGTHSPPQVREHVAVVPGLAVRRYFTGPAAALAAAGVAVQVLPPIAAPEVPPGSLAAVATALAPDLRHQRAPVTLVGHSFGCQVALHLAAQLPDVVTRLVLIGPTVDPAQRRLPVLLAAWLRDMPRESRRLGLEQLPDWWRAGARRIAAGIQAALEDRPEDVAAHLQVAATVVRGQADPICRHAWAAELAALLSARLLVVPQAGRAWPYSRPETFVEVLHLAGVRGQS